MSDNELVFIKQEPELNIVCDADEQLISATSTDNNVGSQWLNEITNHHRTDDHSDNVKHEVTDNETAFTNDPIARRRIFQCYMCTKSYTTRHMLKLHINSIHLQYRPFKCELCLRSFADKYTLTTHIRIHSGERPYSCPVCDKTFVQHSAVTKHIRTHTKEKPFQCEICLKSFSDRSSLIPHKKIHNGEVTWNRSFKCEICGTSFVKNSHLVRHNKTKSHLKQAIECSSKDERLPVEETEATFLC
ncbi:Zinc finger protein [Pseudolycoriella hygida]|uniref:Zinc finger protein n=1 Tax=Pseudolycoriella hygida TaxID=35572 RepID=A0A9Q0S0Q1_9DIPT|nr:Zinc finger protein [Pseudolycoriella hygida]